jgi:hypothetical protein
MKEPEHRNWVKTILSFRCPFSYFLGTRLMSVRFRNSVLKFEIESTFRYLFTYMTIIRGSLVFYFNFFITMIVHFCC